MCMSTYKRKYVYVFVTYITTYYINLSKLEGDHILLVSCKLSKVPYNKLNVNKNCYF